MTTMQIGFSATFPGSWIGLATAYGDNHATTAATPNGVQQGSAVFQPNILVAAPTIQLAQPGAAGTLQWDIITATPYAASSPNAARSVLAASKGTVTVLAYQSISTQIFNATGYSLTPGTETYQTITADAPWNDIKEVALSSLSATQVTIRNFVDVSVDTGTDTAAHTIDLELAKRGTITALSGNETVAIHFLSNEYTWSNAFNVSLGNGTNSVYFSPSVESSSTIATSTPMNFNTDPSKSLLNLTVGNGSNSIYTIDGSANIHLGSGNDLVSLTGGHDEVWLGAGSDTVLINPGLIQTGLPSNPGVDTVHIGAGTSTIILNTSPGAAAANVTITMPFASAGTTQIALVDNSGGPQPSDWSHVIFNIQGDQGGSYTLAQTPDATINYLLIQSANHQFSRAIELNGGSARASDLIVHFS